MANINSIVTEINTNLPNNENQEITAERLRNTLVDIVYSVQECYDISANTGNTYDGLSSALGTNGENVPTTIRKSGITVRFNNSLTNKYEEWRYLLSNISDANFTNVNNWQGVDDEPISGSNNLVKSGGVYGKISPLETQVDELDDTVNTIEQDTQYIADPTEFQDGTYYFCSSLEIGRSVTITEQSHNDWKAIAPIKVFAGEKFTVTGTGTDRYRVFYLLDAKGILRMVADSGTISDTFTITQDGFLYVNSRYQEPSLKVFNLIKPRLTKIENLIIDVSDEFEQIKQEEQKLKNAISEHIYVENPFNGTVQMNGKGIIFNKLFSAGTYVNKVRFYIHTAIDDDIYIYAFTKNNDTFTIIKNIVNCGVLPVGNNEVSINYLCPADCYIGIYTKSSTKPVYLLQSLGRNYNCYRILTSYLDEGDEVTTSEWNYYPSISIDYQGSFYDFEEIKTTVDQHTEEINETTNNVKKLRKNKLVLFDRVTSFNGSVHRLSNFTLDENTHKITSGTGDSYYLYNKRFISDQRKCSYDIQLPESGTPIIRFGTMYSTDPTETLYTTCCEINRATGKLIIYKGGFSKYTTELVEIKSADIVNTINSSRLLVTLERNRKITTVKVYDYYTRVMDEISFDGNGVLFKNGAGLHRPYYFLYTDTAGITLNSLSIFGPYDVSLVHLGDSLSESNGRADTTIPGTNWIEMVMDMIGWDGSIVAQSGMPINNLLVALDNEVQYIKPKMISVMIGTNNGAPIEKYQTVIDWCSQRNIPLIMCNIPMTYPRDPSATNSAEYIAAELDSLNVQVVRMNDATAIDGNATNGADLTCFVPGDQIHTNQLGNYRMFERFKMDAPQILFFNR